MAVSNAVSYCLKILLVSLFFAKRNFECKRWRRLVNYAASVNHKAKRFFFHYAAAKCSRFNSKRMREKSISMFLFSREGIMTIFHMRGEGTKDSVRTHHHTNNYKKFHEAHVDIHLESNVTVQNEPEIPRFLINQKNAGS